MRASWGKYTRASKGKHLRNACVGLHPTCLQALCLHSFMTEEEPGVSDRDFSGLVDREDLTRLKHGPRTTPTVCWKQQARHSKRLPVIVGTDKCKREGHSGGQRTGEAGTGRAGDIQRAREQPSWMADHTAPRAFQHFYLIKLHLRVSSYVLYELSMFLHLIIVSIPICSSPIVERANSVF